MKKLISLSALFLGLSAFSQVQNPGEYCEELSFSSSKKDCYQLLSENSIDPKAGLFCVKEISFESEAIKCLRGSVNKLYSETDIQVCSEATFNDDKANCMIAAGRNFADADCEARLDEARNLVRKIKRSLENGRVGVALRTVADLLYILD